MIFNGKCRVCPLFFLNFDQKKKNRLQITEIFEGWDPSKADQINSDFEAKMAAQKKRDDLEEKAREFALTQTYSSEVRFQVHF